MKNSFWIPQGNVEKTRPSRHAMAGRKEGRIPPLLRKEKLPSTFHGQKNTAVGKKLRHKNRNVFQTGRIHMYGIFTYIYHKNQPNVGPIGKYTSPMDAMGDGEPWRTSQSSQRLTWPHRERMLPFFVPARHGVGCDRVVRWESWVVDMSRKDMKLHRYTYIIRVYKFYPLVN